MRRLFRPSPGVLDDCREEHNLDGATQKVVVPLANGCTGDSKCIDNCERDVGDSVEPRFQGFRMSERKTMRLGMSTEMAVPNRTP